MYISSSIQIHCLRCSYHQANLKIYIPPFTINMSKLQIIVNFSKILPITCRQYKSQVLHHSVSDKRDKIKYITFVSAVHRHTRDSLAFTGMCF